MSKDGVINLGAEDQIRVLRSEPTVKGHDVRGDAQSDSEEDVEEPNEENTSTEAADFDELGPPVMLDPGGPSPQGAPTVLGPIPEETVLQTLNPMCTPSPPALSDVNAATVPVSDTPVKDRTPEATPQTKRERSRSPRGQALDDVPMCFRRPEVTEDA